MILIPGFIISILTFPGVMVHECAHMLFCRLRGVPVLEVCFFRIGNPAGYVVHGDIENFNTAFLVSVGPFIVNSLLCIIICLLARLVVGVFDLGHPLWYFVVCLYWLGLSIGMHAFPSTGDAKVLLKHAKKAASSLSPLAIISFPLVILIYLGNILSVVWADLLYALALGFCVPALLL
ncbi:DUF3267 domain-containing protein [bacterium]|nr:DUF3267 domain-containing protein [bacterium]